MGNKSGTTDRTVLTIALGGIVLGLGVGLSLAMLSDQSPDTNSANQDSQIDSDYPSDEKQIRDILKSLDPNQGKANPDVLIASYSAASIDYWEDLRKMAITVGKDELKALDPNDWFGILELRTLFSKQQLEQLDGKSALRAYLDSTSTVQTKSNQHTFMDWVIEVDGNSAVAYLPVLRKFYLHFVKENGRWYQEDMALHGGFRAMMEAIATQDTEKNIDPAQVQTAMDLLFSLEFIFKLHYAEKAPESILYGPRDESLASATTPSNPSDNP